MRIAKCGAIILSCATVLISATGEHAYAQGNAGVAIGNEFEAKAAERRRRKAAPLNLPEFEGSRAGSSSGPAFRLARLRVQGVHSVSQDEIASIYRPYLGRSVTQADLGKICEAITALYKDKGYALSRAFVPPQDIEGGRVVVQVVEGHIAEVSVEGLGSDWFIARDIVDGMTRERPIRLATLERHMLLLSDLPGIQIKDAALKEIGTGSGRFRLIITASFLRGTVNLDLDNRGSHQMGPWQSFNTVALNSVLRRGDTLVVNGATIADDPRQLGYIGSIYETPVGSSGARLGLRQAFSEGWPAGFQRTYDVRTRSQDYAVYGAYSPLRTRQTSLKLTAGLAWREVEEVSSLGQHYGDHVRLVSGAMDIQHQDGLKGANFISLGARQGVAAFGATGADDFSSSRTGAESDFTKLTALAVRYQALAGPFSLMLATSAQITSGPVVKSEAFAFGGSFLGRAFAPGALISDSGVAGIAELRFDQRLEAGPLKATQLYAFTDRGVLWTRGGDTQVAGSWGGGMRVLLDRDTRLGLEVATVAEAPSYMPHETRVYFSVGRTFTFGACLLAACN